jgi:hypothetical protein
VDTHGFDDGNICELGFTCNRRKEIELRRRRKYDSKW